MCGFVLMYNFIPMYNSKRGSVFELDFVRKFLKELFPLLEISGLTRTPFKKKK